MALAQHKRAVGVFSNRRDAEHAFNELKSSGFPMDKISVIARDADREGEIAGVDVRDRAGNKADEGAAAGALTGGTLGGITGLLVGAGALAIPGVGPVLLAGEIATTLATAIAGGAIGAAAGGLVGALIGLGIPEERAKIYNDRVSRGDYLVLVQGTDAEIAKAEAILHGRGIEEWGIYDAPDATPATSSYAAMPTGGIAGATMPTSGATGMPMDYVETPLENQVTPVTTSPVNRTTTPVDRSRTTEADVVSRQRIPSDPNAELAPQRRAIGVFANRREAENALTELSISGFPMDKVSVLAKNSDGDDISGGNTQAGSDRIGDKADEGAIAGAAAGGALGGMTGLLVGLGALAVPGIGPVMAAGAMGTTLATALSGGALGAAAGGLVGALVGLGIPEERAKIYNERLSRGEYLLFLDGSREQVQTAETTLSNRGIQEWGTFDAVELKPRVTIIDRRDETRR